MSTHFDTDIYIYVLNTFEYTVLCMDAMWHRNIDLVAVSLHIPALMHPGRSLPDVSGAQTWSCKNENNLLFWLFAYPSQNVAEVRRFKTSQSRSCEPTRCV